MNKSNIALAVVMQSFIFPVLAQEQKPKTIKRISVYDYHVQAGISLERNNTATYSDFEKLAPNSVLLTNNLANYSSYNGVSLNGNNMFSAILGLQFSDKQKSLYKSNPILRVGISYFSSTTLSSNVFNEVRKPYDTLTSNQTGQTIYIDSLITKNYSMNYTSDQLRFDGSLIFRTDSEARWSLFGGIGFTAGFSINANTYIHHNNSLRTETRNQNGNVFFAYNPGSMDVNRSERFKNKTNFVASAYIPMGVDFRIGKKREFWKRTHLFYELRPGVNITTIPELRTITTASLQQGLGVRVKWN
jgi:hypothetical protein